MDDRDVDCKTDEDLSSTKQSNGKVAWVLHKGLRLGKKAVITGFVISLAAFVLPLLVVLSTLGFACSVPFGLLFATYACTQIIMNKLLPAQESSSVLEYDEGEDDYNLVQGAEERGYEVEVDDLVQGAEERGYEVDVDDLVQGEEERGFEVEVDDLVQGAEERGFEEEVNDLVQGVKGRGYREDYDDLVQRAAEQGYEEDDEEEENELTQEAEEQGRDGLIKKVMIEAEEQGQDGFIEEFIIEEGVKEEVKNALVVVEGGDILQQRVGHWQDNVENQDLGIVGLGVTSIELDGRNSILPEGAALLPEYVPYEQNGIEKYNEPSEQEILKLDVLQGVGMKSELDENATDSVQKPLGEEEIPEAVVEGGASKIEFNDSSGLASFQDDGRERIVKFNEEQLEQEKLRVDVLQGVGTKTDLDENVSEHHETHKQNPTADEQQPEQVAEGAARTIEMNAADRGKLEGGDTFQNNRLKGTENHKEEPLLEQEKIMMDVLQGHGMKHESDESATNSMKIHKQKLIAEEKQSLETVEADVRTIKSNVNDSSEVFSFQDDGREWIVKYNEEPLEQEKLMLDVLQGVGMTNELDENVTESIEFHKQKLTAEEEQSEEVAEGDEGTIELNETEKGKLEGGDTFQKDGWKDPKNHTQEPLLEQEKLILNVLQVHGMKCELDENATNSMDIYKRKPIGEEKQSTEIVEGDARTMKLNVSDSSELERVDTFQVSVYDGKNGVAVLKEESDDMNRGMLMRNGMDAEARNDTQEGGILLEDADYGRNSVEKHREKQMEVIEHCYEEGYKEEIAKYFQGENIFSVEGREVGNEKLFVEDKNEEPIIEMRQVVVSVRGGKKIAGEQENENIRECNKSEKLVLVAKKVTELTVGDICINYNEELAGGTTGFSERIKDEPKEGLSQESREPDKSFEVKIIADEEKGDSSMSVAREISMKKTNRPSEEKLKHENYVEPKNILSNLNSASEIVDECGLDLFDLSADRPEVGNEKLIVEKKNEEPVIELGQVIVSVRGGKQIAGEQENENVKECNKSEKLVLVVKKVTESNVGDIYVNYNEELVEGTRDDTDKRRKFIETPKVSLEVKIVADEEKRDSLTLVASKISTKEINGIFEEKMEHENYVEPKNILSDLNSARGIADECCLDLFDYSAGDHHSYYDFNLSQESDNIRSKETDDIADLPVLQVSTKVAESKHICHLPESDPATPYCKELLNEENIWEQIDALRAIMGCSAPTHTRSVEEIKALYIFIGIESPPSFAEGSNLVEVNEMLQVLKSVVGVT